MMFRGSAQAQGWRHRALIARETPRRLPWESAAKTRLAGTHGRRHNALPQIDALCRHPWAWRRKRALPRASSRGKQPPVFQPREARGPDVSGVAP